MTRRQVLPEARQAVHCVENRALDLPFFFTNQKEFLPAPFFLLGIQPTLPLSSLIPAFLALTENIIRSAFELLC